MNLTPLQQRRLQQTKEEISFYEKRLRKKGIPIYLKASVFVVAAIFLFNLLWDVFIEKKTWANAIAIFNWKETAIQFLFWLLVYYYFFRGEGYQLRNKKKELAMLRKKYGMEDEPTELKKSEIAN